MASNDKAELANLYHLAQTAVGYKRHDRMKWAAAQYAKKHGISNTKAYLMVERAIS
jgi:hypothetical protein